MILHVIPADEPGRVRSKRRLNKAASVLFKRERGLPRSHRPVFGHCAPANAGTRGDGRFRGHIREPARPEGSGVGSGPLPGGVGARGRGRPLLLPGARPAGDRWRRRAPEAGDRRAARRLRDLLGGPREPRHGLLRRKPHPEDRPGRTRGAAGGIPRPCGDHGHGGLRRAGLQVSDLGAGALRRAGSARRARTFAR